MYSHRHTCSQALQVLPATTLPPTCVRQGRMNDFCSPANPAGTHFTLLPTCTLPLPLSDFHSQYLLCPPASPSSYHHTSRHCRIRSTYLYIRASSRRIDKLSHLPSNLCGSSKSCKTQRNLGQAPMDVFPEAETCSHVLPVLVSVANEMLSIQRRRLHSTLWWRSSRLLWELVDSGRSHFPSSYAAGIRNCFTSPSSLSSSTTTRCTTLAHPISQRVATWCGGGDDDSDDDDDNDDECICRRPSSASEIT